MFGFEGMGKRREEGSSWKKILRIILDSSMVEHSAVNRVVVGSSPTRGGKNSLAKTCRHAVYRFLCILSFIEKQSTVKVRVTVIVTCCFSMAGYAEDKIIRRIFEL